MRALGWGKYFGCMAVLCGWLMVALPVAWGASTPAQWAIIVYISGDENIQPLAEQYRQYLEVVGGSNQVVALAEVVVADQTGQGGVEADRYFYDRSGQRQHQSMPLTGQSQVARIANLIKWGRQKAAAQRYALVVVGHGQLAPALAAGDEVQPEGTAANGNAVRLTVGKLRAALTEGLEGRQLDALFLDCCFGSSIEVAAEFKEMARYLVGTPGLMYSPGLPWDEILSWLTAHPEAGARGLVEQAVKSLGNYWRREPDVPVSLTAIDLSEVDTVRRQLSALSAAATKQMPAIIPQITLARSRTENWGKRAELVDLGGFAVALSLLTDYTAVAHRARQVAWAAEQAIVASYLQGPLAPARTRHEGLAVFFPLDSQQWPDTYRESADGEIQKCWLPFLSSYVTGLHRLLVGKLAPGAQSG